MFKKISFILALGFSVNSYASQGEELSPYQQQCRIVDRFVAGGSTIEPALEYVKVSLAQKAGFAEVLARLVDIDQLPKTTALKDLDWFKSFNDEQKLWTICLSDIRQSRHARLSAAQRTRDVAKLLGLMLSPELSSLEIRQRWGNHPYDLIKSAIVSAHHTLYLEYRAMLEGFDFGVRVVSSDTSESSLKPLMMLSPHNAYELKTFFYALSRGVSLYGLCKDQFAGHGRAFLSPLLATAHDQGHEGELFERQAISRSGDQTIEVLKHFSSQLLGLLDNQDVFLDAKEVNRALFAAFLMIHEIQIKAYALKCYESLDFFGEGKRINLALLFKSKEHRLGLNQFQADFPANFVYRFFSDLAFELLNVAPNLEPELFPYGTDVVRAELLREDDFNSKDPLSYNLERTVEECVNLLSWLEGKLLPHLKVIDVIEVVEDAQ